MVGPMVSCEMFPYLSLKPAIPGHGKSQLRAKTAVSSPRAKPMGNAACMGGRGLSTITT